jgi:dihydropteroate synthase
MDVWRCRDHELPLGARTLIMGVVNVTPDSFSGDGVAGAPKEAVARGLAMAAEGADLLDVGGESTRPGSSPVSSDEEAARVVPVIEGLVAGSGAPVSVDTAKASVARAALDAGASIVNDVRAGRDPGMLDAIASAGAGAVLMHMQGEPRTMQDDPRYDDVVGEVRAFLAERLAAAEGAGIARDRLCVDPGIGFGKDLDHNLSLLRAVRSFRDLGVALLVGASRKRFVGTLTEVEDAGDRLEGSIAAAVWCAGQGVDVVRVHDVGATARALRVADAIARGPA